MGFSRIPLVGFLTSLIVIGFLWGKASTSSESFACSDLIPLVEWSIKHHGMSSKKLTSLSFAEKAAELFAEKTDPERLLFVESEVESLKKTSQKNWARFLKNKDCSFFQSWYTNQIPVARKRILKTASDWTQSNVWPKTKLKKIKYQKPTHFLATEADLILKQQAFFKSILSETPDLVRKAYSSNPVLFFEERIQSIVLPQEQNAFNLFAKALLGTLDPYSTYLSKKEFSDFYEELSGLNSGVGISVEKSPHSLSIVEVVPKSPAALAGIRVGDEIVSINGTALKGLDFQACTRLLKGPADTEISLTVLSAGHPKEVKMARTPQVFRDKRVSTQIVKSKQAKNVALVSIPSFYGRGGMKGFADEELSSSEDLKNQIKKIKEDPHIDAVVLDLRGNPGGYLEEAVQMAGVFLGDQTVVGVKDQDVIQKMRPDENAAPLFNGPLLVWVDEETASAGEVLAAALKDHQRALLVGTPSTFGKGSVQKLFQIDDPFLNVGVQSTEGVIKLTTSVFYSPLGHSPANGGVSTHLALVDKAEENENKLKVNDISPLLDETELEKLKKSEPEFQKVIDQIDINMGQDKDLKNKVTEIAAVYSNLSQIH